MYTHAYVTYMSGAGLGMVVLAVTSFTSTSSWTTTNVPPRNTPYTPYCSAWGNVPTHLHNLNARLSLKGAHGFLHKRPILSTEETDFKGAGTHLFVGRGGWGAGWGEGRRRRGGGGSLLQLRVVATRNCNNATGKGGEGEVGERERGDQRGNKALRGGTGGRRGGGRGRGGGMGRGGLSYEEGSVGTEEEEEERLWNDARF
jgi:hypothetical protein